MDPQKKAMEILNSLPNNKFISKTGFFLTSTAASLYAISNQFIVFHEESVLLFSFILFLCLFFKYIGPLFDNWANKEIKEMSEFMNGAKIKDIEKINERINELKPVINGCVVTKQLFDLSRVVLQLESDSFELKQKIFLRNKAKHILDSWVSFENSKKQRQQELIAKNVVENIYKKIDNSKFRDQILSESLQKIDNLFSKK